MEQKNVAAFHSYHETVEIDEDEDTWLIIPAAFAHTENKVGSASVLDIKEPSDGDGTPVEKSESKGLSVGGVDVDSFETKTKLQNSVIQNS